MNVWGVVAGIKKIFYLYLFRSIVALHSSLARRLIPHNVVLNSRSPSTTDSKEVPYVKASLVEFAVTICTTNIVLAMLVELKI
ncbi:hypothetical protein PVAP13_4NG026962 [Panicum virgatum]|uniref:Uncharacterized protein n=1 Tax=Panicum virgatum TaxID=38727 RepID=A0A8T0T3W5_PANVG|nr:hypothetical protein PVAP13_4NG026962 [Panicum virgatum]